MKQAENNKEIEVLQMYLEELKTIPKAEEKELELLFQMLRNGEEQARKRLIDTYLLTAVEMAAKYKNRGVSLTDLIQEANMGLIEAVSNEEEIIDDAYIRKNIEKALKKAIQEEAQINEIEEYVVENVNQLNEAARELAEINGKEPAIEELAEYLHKTEEEIREFMKMSLDASSLL